MPLFLDSNSNSPCSDAKTKEYMLLNGNYQIPVYYQFPKDPRDISFQAFQKLEKIPCCSLLIRIRKASQGPDGKNISLGVVKLQKAIEMGAIDIPVNYPEGNYNNTYNPISSTESIIFEAKLRRQSPSHKDLISALVNESAIVEESKMSEEDIKTYCEEKLLQKPPGKLIDIMKMPYLSFKFMSEYIPQLGFNTEVKFIHKPQTQGFYFIVVSLVPPGRLYKSQMRNVGLLDSHSATDVQVMHKLDFDSTMKAISFNNEDKNFYVTQTDKTAVLIYEVYNVTLKNNQVDKVTTHGFSVLPLFQYVQVDGTIDSVEVFIGSGLFQLPLFKGAPDANFIDKVVEKPNVGAFLESNVQEKNLEIIPKSSLIVMLKDNQYEEAFSNIELA